MQKYAGLLILKRSKTRLPLFPLQSFQWEADMIDGTSLRLYSKNIIPTVASKQVIPVSRGVGILDKNYSKKLAPLSEQDLLDNAKGGSIRDSVSFKEIKLYIHSSISKRDWDSLDNVIQKCISQFSIHHKRQVMLIITSSINHILMAGMKHRDKNLILRGFLNWANWIKLLNGSCESTDYMRDKLILQHLLHFIRLYNIKFSQDDILSLCNQILLQITDKLGPSAASQFASTLITLFEYNDDLPSTDSIFQWKNKYHLPIIPSDLTKIMRCYNIQKKYEQIQHVYNKNPQAHGGESIQFDYLLLSHTRLQNWVALRNQFENLFGIGKLPNVNHYEITIFAMAYEGELDKVEELFNQFLRRKMLPTYSILQSLLYVHFKCKKYLSCFEQFQLFEKYSIKPSQSTYLIMFKVFKELSNLEGALKLLKQITERKETVVNEDILSTMIQLCSKFTNSAIADELFNVMIEYYDIKPTGKSISSLMNVYIESHLFDKVINLFNEYRENISDPNQIIWLYNKAIVANMEINKIEECQRLFNEVSDKKIMLNQEFHEILIQYMLVVKQDHEVAGKYLEALLSAGNKKVKAKIFAVMMNEYDKLSNYSKIFHLYDLMVKNNIMLNSKVLYFIIKATFETQIRNGEALTKSIELVTQVMENISHRKLPIEYDSIHPAVISWPLRAIAKYYNPRVALNLLNKYNDLFSQRDDKLFKLDNKLVNSKTLVILYGELEQWNNVDIAFENILNQLDRYKKLPSSTMINRRLQSIFNGIIFYKVRQLRETNQIEKLPSLVDKLTQEEYLIDNKSWNCIIRGLMSDFNTIKVGMKYVNSKLIHGYNLIHKYRLLRRQSTESKSFLLRVKMLNPGKFQASLYLHSSTYDEIFVAMDKYFADVGTDKILELVKEYPYLMKGYLLKPRTSIVNWEEFERHNAVMLSELRISKRIHVLRDVKK